MASETLLALRSAFASGSRSSNARKSLGLLNESPKVVGIMTVVIGNGGSLDVAIRNVAKDGPAMSAALFGKVVEKADTRIEADMKTSLTKELAALPDSVTAYSMAIHMVMSAAEARDGFERERILHEASDIALTGLKDAGKTYSASLNLPCMAVFGIGIMMPMILMSIIPMLSISGVFGAPAFGIVQLAILTLVLIPVIVAVVMFSIKERNPFLSTSDGLGDVACAVPLILALPFALVLTFTGMDPVVAGCIGCIAAGVLALFAVYPGYMKEMLRRRRAILLEDAIFELGNRLVSGETFEEALVRSIASREDCGPIAEALRRELTICRGDISAAIRAALDPVSRTVAEMVCCIYDASRKDLRDAGKLALSVGRQMKDQESVRRGIKADLRGMTDTMFSTASIFAPLVLGLSTSMLVPLTRMSEASGLSGTSLVLTAYLAELCVMISVLMSFLEGSVKAESVVRRIGMMLPLSMAVFLVSMSVQF